MPGFSCFCPGLAGPGHCAIDNRALTACSHLSASRWELHWLALIFLHSPCRGREDFPIYPVAAFISVLHPTPSRFDWFAISPTLFWSLSVLYSLPPPWKGAEPRRGGWDWWACGTPNNIIIKTVQFSTTSLSQSIFLTCKSPVWFWEHGRGGMCEEAGNEWEGRSRLILCV